MGLEVNTILFLLAVVLGTVVQTFTGFALGLVVMVAAALFSLADVAFAAAVVSFVSLANTIVALRSGRRHIDWMIVRWLMIGSLPAMVIIAARLAVEIATSAIRLNRIVLMSMGWL